MNVARLSLAALVLVGLIGVARAEDKKEAPKTEAVDFRKLKELMPAELNGLKRSECNGERNKIGDMSISQVTATYKKGDEEGAQKIEVQVMDYSNLEMAKGMAAAWTTIEIDKESDNGFEKTIKIKDNPGFLTWQKDGKHGQVQLLVGGRYVVSVQTDNIPSDQVIKVAEALPLDKLAALK
ncbi:MAG: transposase [Phycisphaerales bacterium]|nr:transposase [Phycisphaerales bacterium]